MDKITDSDRIDFLQEQNITLWIGYSTPGDRDRGFLGKSHTWPIFPGVNRNLREEIDKAIRSRNYDLERRDAIYQYTEEEDLESV